MKRHEICIKLLIDNGIDANIVDIDYGFSALHYSVQNNNYTIAKTIMVSTDPNIQDYIGNTPLNYAIINKGYALLELFMDNNKINVNINRICYYYIKKVLTSKY